MALSFVQYPGDGAKRDFQLTFGYLAKAHVSVSVNGNPYLDYTFTSSFMVRLAVAPAKDSVVEVRRTTPRNAPLVDFVDGSTLTETDLDTATLQVFYLAQEAYDMAGGTLAIASDGSYSANTRRIANVGNPVNAQDVVTKLWAETALSSQLSLAIGAKDAAVIARQGSETARSGSEAARTGSEAARDEARAHRDTASAHRLNAQNSQVASEVARDVAVKAKVELEAARDIAVTKASESTASAAAAAKSAQDAALFDPSSYYTRVQVDSKVAAVDLTSRVSKSGDTMTGQLVMDGVNINMRRGTVNRYIHHNAGFLGFLNSSGGWSLQSGDNGDLVVAGHSYANGNVRSGGNLRSDGGTVYAGSEGGSWASLNYAGQIHINGAYALTINSDGNIYSNRYGGWLTDFIEGRAGVQGQSWANDRVANLQYRLVSLGSIGIGGTVDVPSGAVAVGLSGVTATSDGQQRMTGVTNIRYRYPQIYDPVRGWIGFGNA